MPLLIFIVFIFVWYFPVWAGQGAGNRLPVRSVLNSVLLGIFPVFFSALILQILLGNLYRALSVPYLLNKALSAYVDAALVEEGFKFLGAYLVIRRLNPRRKSDYILIFGAVGLGFEITETLLELDSPLTGAVRGMFAMHIIWGFWMGSFFWEYRQSGKSGFLLLSLFVPFLLHGTNDFLCFVGLDQLPFIDENLPSGLDAANNLSTRMNHPEDWILALLLFLILYLVFQIYTYCMALRASSKSRKAAEPSMTAESVP